MRTADLQDYGVNRDSVLHVVLRYLAVLVNGIPAAEARMGQAIALLANWEMNAWSADPVQASFYAGDPAEGRSHATLDRFRLAPVAFCKLGWEARYRTLAVLRLAFDARRGILITARYVTACRDAIGAAMDQDFDVAAPRGFSRFMLGTTALLALVPIGFALAGELPVAGAVSFAILLSPFLLAAVWARRFKVTVRQGLVSVNPGLIRGPWSFTAGDVTKVVRHINHNKSVGTMTKMTVRARGRRVSIETLMQGSEEFEEFILENVDAGRIVTKVHGSPRE